MRQTLRTVLDICNRIKSVHLAVYEQDQLAAYLPDFGHDITGFVDL